MIYRSDTSSRDAIFTYYASPAPGRSRVTVATTKLVAAALLAFVLLILSVASCNAFRIGYDSEKCFDISKDEPSCASCCKSVPNGKGSKFSDGKCNCIDADGKLVPNK